MARFMTTVDNSRGKSVNVAGESIGQHLHIRGWDSGVKVESYRQQDDQDGFAIYMTDGSNGHGQKILIGRVLATLTGVKFVPADEDG